MATRTLPSIAAAILCGLIAIPAHAQSWNDLTRTPNSQVLEQQRLQRQLLDEQERQTQIMRQQLQLQQSEHDARFYRCLQVRGATCYP